MDSILTTIKQLLGIEEDDISFDTDIVVYINSAFSKLRELGVGPTKGFRIQDDTAIWDDFISTDDTEKFEMIKEFIYIRVKLVFDPPASATVLQSMKDILKEDEWYLYLTADNRSSEEGDVNNE